MPELPRVARLRLVTAEKHGWMQDVSEVLALQYRGLLGDQRCLEMPMPEKELLQAAHISIMALDAGRCNDGGKDIQFESQNVLLQGITFDELAKLVGKKFWLGDALVLGTRLAPPYKSNGSGIYGAILQSGKIREGDVLHADVEQYSV